MRYRIVISQHDVNRETIFRFDAPGNKSARKVLDDYSKKERYSLDDLDLERIDAPAVPERITRVSYLVRNGLTKERLIHFT